MADVNTCHCCEGLSVQTPIRINNRPGLDAVAYRVGTHRQFKQSLLARLSLSGKATLSGLTSREDDDFTIGLMDAWSVVSDVLTFYQERIANESYLRTATERFSILELARMIGYELNPGVAASAYIAFTLDDTPGALGPVLGVKDATNLLEGLPPITIEKGIKIQSIPGPGEKAQTYETIAGIEARPVWNAIRPQLTIPQSPLNENVIIFKGTNLNLKQGDELLIRELITPGTAIVPKSMKALKVLIDNDAQTTRVDLGVSPVLPGYSKPVLVHTGSFNNFLMPYTFLQQGVVNNMMNKVWREADLSALTKTNRWSFHELSQSVNTPPPAVVIQTDSTTGVYVFRKKVSVFGYNAPKKIKYNGDVPANPVEWDEWSIKDIEKPGMLYLDSAYDEIIPGSYITIKNPVDSMVRFYKVDKAEVSSRTEYGISTKTTKLAILPSDDWWGAGTDLAAIRSITVFAQSELLDLAELPLDYIVQGNTITLGRYYPGLKVGQAVILSGERQDLNGVVSSELAFLSDITVKDGLTILTFKESLTYTYKPKTVYINANVSQATHGETVQEVLGGGNAVIPFQQFALRQPPLTYITASTPSGTETSLEIRVNDLLWKEVDYFLDHLPDERIYITRQNNEGKTTVIFGDGITGARLPTGQENVKAKYRKGIGAAGLVKADQLSQLMTKPLGVKSAVNPVAASGAEDPEPLEEARTNAPLTILTLGRIVSLQDYEDFARAFAGIGKSLATWTWKSQQRHVYITVAGSNGELVDKKSNLYINLLDAIKKAGNPKITLTVESYIPAFFQVVANLVADPVYLPEKVKADVETRLRDTFSFEKRKFGQPVSFSEVISCIQNTNGVVAVDIDYLYRSDSNQGLSDILECTVPGPANENIIAAELLTLDSRPIDLKILR